MRECVCACVCDLVSDTNIMVNINKSSSLFYNLNIILIVFLILKKPFILDIVCLIALSLVVLLGLVLFCFVAYLSNS